MLGGLEGRCFGGGEQVVAAHQKQAEHDAAGFGRGGGITGLKALAEESAALPERQIHWAHPRPASIPILAAWAAGSTRGRPHSRLLPHSRGTGDRKGRA